MTSTPWISKLPVFDNKKIFSTDLDKKILCFSLDQKKEDVALALALALLFCPYLLICLICVVCGGRIDDMSIFQGAAVTGGDLPELGPPEKKKFDEFKTILSSNFDDFGKEEATSKYPGLDADHTLMRFLAAKNYDLTKCVTQYSNWRKWVLENNPSQWRATEPPLNDVHQKLHVGNWQGVGKLGHAVYIEKLGACSMAALNKLSSPEKFGLHHMWKNENLMKKNEEQSQKLGKCVYKVINIVDMKGLNMGHRHGIPFFAVTAGMDAEYYPETVEQAFVVNAPWVFPAIYSLAKIFIDPNTRQKIHVLSGGVETWSKTILEYVDADQLPAEYGKLTHTL